MSNIYAELTKALEQNVAVLQGLEIQSREYDHRLEVISQLAQVLSGVKGHASSETSVAGFDGGAGKDEPTPKRTRKKRETKKEETMEDSNISDTPTGEEAPTPDEAPEPTEEPKEKPTLDITTVRRAMAKATKAGVDVQKFLKEHGFDKLSEAPVEDYNDLYEGITALMGGIE